MLTIKAIGQYMYMYMHTQQVARARTYTRYTLAHSATHVHALKEPECVATVLAQTNKQPECGETPSNSSLRHTYRKYENCVHVCVHACVCARVCVSVMVTHRTVPQEQLAYCYVSAGRRHIEGGVVKNTYCLQCCHSQTIVHMYHTTLGMVELDTHTRQQVRVSAYCV